MKTLDVHGAYGRIYRDAASAEKDWAEGKDFKIYGGLYLSVRDVPKLIADGYTSVSLWFTRDKLTMEQRPISLMQSTRGRATPDDALLPEKRNT